MFSPIVAQPVLSFRGLQLGMKHTDFWELMDFSMWEYDELFRPDVRDPATIYILSPEPLLVGRRGGTISLGCLRTDTTEICIWIHHAVVEFDAGRMNVLTVATTPYNVRAVPEIQAAASLLLDSLTNQFGTPHRTDYAIDTASTGYIKALPEDNPPALALWEWRSHATTRRVRLYLQSDGGEKCTLWVSMWDTPDPVKRGARTE